MRFLLLLLFWAGAARAQVVASCLPSTIGGTGTKHIYVEDSVGWFGGWLCPNEGTLVQMWGHWAEAPGNWRASLANAALLGKAGIDVLMGQQIRPCAVAPNGGCYTPADLDGVVVPGFQQLVALRAPPPGPQVWKVKPSGTATTRVVYTIVAGKRGPLALNPDKSNVTVSIGAVCDQSIRVDEPLGPLVTTYMGVPGGITVCVKS